MATRTDMYGILFKEIVVEEGFNIRYDYGNLQELADSIVENGIQNPIHCYVKKGDINQYTLIEGHRRYKAVQLAIKQGKLDAETFRIPMVKGRNLSDVDRTYGLVTFNSGKNLTMLEEAMVYERLANYRVPVGDIAKKVGKSTTHINNCLTLCAANLGTKKMIMDGTVSATLVIDLLKKKEPKEVEAELKAAATAQKEALKEEEDLQPTKKAKDTGASEDVPKRQDNTKSAGKDTREMAGENGKAVKITKKNLAKDDKPKEVKFNREQLKTILEALKEECVGYQERGVPNDLDIETWMTVNVD